MKYGTGLRRFGALAMAAALSLSLAVMPAFADETDTDPAGNTLTIANALEGAVYKIYPVLKLSSEGLGAGAYRYQFSDASIAAAIRSDLEALVERDEFKSYGGDLTNPGLGWDSTNRVYAGFTVDGNDLRFDLQKIGTDGKYTVASDDDYTAWSGTTVAAKFKTKFADELKALVEAKIGSLDDAAAMTVTADNNGTASIEGLAAGYYLVISSAGQRAMTSTWPGDGSAWTITEKNSKPTLVKTVVEEDDGNPGTTAYTDKNDKGIGDTVEFKIEVDAGAGVNHLKVEDTLPKGLVFEAIKQISFTGRNDRTMSNESKINDSESYPTVSLINNDGANASSALKGTDGAYSSFQVDITKAGTADGGEKLTFTFAEEWLLSKRVLESEAPANPTAADRGKYTQPASYDDANANQYLGDMSTSSDDGGTIRITYTAKVTGDAMIGGTGNVNEATVFYGNDPASWIESNSDETRTYVYELDILKYVQGNTADALEGAVFTLKMANDYYLKDKNADIDMANGTVTVAKPVASDFGGNLKFTLKDGVYVVDPTAEGEDADKLTSGSDGKIRIAGLDSSLYELTETTAPAGYIKASTPFYVILGSVASETVELSADKAVTMHTFVYDGDQGADSWQFKKATMAASSPDRNSEVMTVANASGIQMPEAGGAGTVMIYVAGIGLLGVAALVFVMKKRAGVDAGSED